MNTPVDEASLISICLDLLASDRRRFVAIAGAPGSGKSTLVKQLLEALSVATRDSQDSERTLQAGASDQADQTNEPLDKRNSAMPLAAILPMDGFHYDDAILKARERLPWKGAPDTFDVGGLRSMLARLADPAEESVATPVFDRHLEISRGSACIIPQSIKLVLVEGNYLLLNQEPWKSLHPYFDIKVMIDVPEAELARRLHKRWVYHGLDEAGIAMKLDGNDLPNGRTVREQSIDADYRMFQ